VTRATAFAPGSIGNVGPGFDVLGLAVEGIGDTVTVILTDGPARVDSITGRDAELVPRDPQLNAAVIAAIAFLRAHADNRNPLVAVEKGLPLAGGLGGSAASSVGGAYAAALAMGANIQPMEIIAAALEGEAAVAGRHLDNIAASVLGGLTISRSLDPLDAIAVAVKEPWWVALVTPNVRIETKTARAILPLEWDRSSWVQQMANTTALTYAFASGDGDLVRRSLDDRYAEPRRAALIPHFHDVKRAAVLAGAFGCSISGSGPTMFAVAEDEAVAKKCATAMQHAFGDIASTAHCGPIAKKGVR
jgi:homoserine kinase